MTAATTPVPRLGSGDAKRSLLAIERRSDLFQACARRVSLERSQRVTAEPRQLEQARQPIDRRVRKDQAPERLAHELFRRLPWRSGHAGLRRDAFESAVASDD